MPQSKANEILVSVINQSTSNVATSWTITHMGQSLNITIKGQMPIGIHETIKATEELRAAIEKVIWHYYATSKRDMPPGMKA